MDIDQQIEELLTRARVPQAYRSGEFLRELGFSISNESIDEMAKARGISIYDFIRLRLGQLVNVCTALDCTLDTIEEYELQLMEMEAVDLLSDETEGILC